MKGKVVMIVIRGMVVMEGDEIIEELKGVRLDV